MQVIKTANDRSRQFLNAKKLTNLNTLKMKKNDFFLYISEEKCL